MLTRFPFTDLSGDKRRLALVFSRDNDRRDDLMVCFITLVPRVGPDIASLAATAGTGFKPQSAVRFDKLATLDRSVITGKLAEGAARMVFQCVWSLGECARSKPGNVHSLPLYHQPGSVLIHYINGSP